MRNLTHHALITYLLDHWFAYARLVYKHFSEREFDWLEQDAAFNFSLELLLVS